MRLDRSFFNRDTVIVAQELLGKHFVCDLKEGKVVAKIVETEAYKGTDDLACHASKGRTKRTEVLFGEVGHLYVYLNYGIFWLTNIVSHLDDQPGGILIRSAEIIEGEKLVRTRLEDHKFTRSNHLLASGPGKFSVALGITGDFHNLDFVKSDKIYIEDYTSSASWQTSLEASRVPKMDIVATKRIGVDYAGHCKDYLWRFYMDNNKFVSKK